MKRINGQDIPEIDELGGFSRGASASRLVIAACNRFLAANGQRPKRHFNTHRKGALQPARKAKR